MLMFVAGVCPNQYITECENEYISLLLLVEQGLEESSFWRNDIWLQTFENSHDGLQRPKASVSHSGLQETNSH